MGIHSYDWIFDLEKISKIYHWPIACATYGVSMYCIANQWIGSLYVASNGSIATLYRMVAIYRKRLQENTKIDVEMRTIAGRRTACVVLFCCIIDEKMTHML